MIRLWNRLITMEDIRITKQAFHMDYDNCCNNWTSELKSIMTKIDVSNCFREKTVINMTEAKSRIIYLYASIWRSDIQRIPKLRTYRTFKTEFTREQYLTLNLRKCERSVMCQFRTGILPLQIETGRYTGVPANQRYCVLCTDSQHCVENELHFLFQCDRDNDLRNGKFKDLFNDNTSLDVHLIHLMANRSRTLAKFLYQAYLTRRSYLYS